MTVNWYRCRRYIQLLAALLTVASQTALAQSDPMSWTKTLPVRGDVVTSDEVFHGMVLDAESEVGRLVLRGSSGAACFGYFQVTAESGLGGDFSISCSDGRQGQGNYVLEMGAVTRSTTGVGCVVLKKVNVNEAWVARFVFGDLVFAPGFPAGLTCGAG